MTRRIGRFRAVVFFDRHFYLRVPTRKPLVAMDDLPASLLLPSI